jgi:hypothetical protein
MSTDIRTFRPLAATQTVSVTTTSTTLALNGPGGSRAIRVYNAGASTVFLNLIANGTASTADTTNGLPIPSGGVETFSVSQDVVSIGAITASATATLYVTVGEGL